MYTPDLSWHQGEARTGPTLLPLLGFFPHQSCLPYSLIVFLEAVSLPLKSLVQGLLLEALRHLVSHTRGRGKALSKGQAQCREEQAGRRNVAGGWALVTTESHSNNEPKADMLGKGKGKGNGKGTGQVGHKVLGKRACK